MSFAGVFRNTGHPWVNVIETFVEAVVLEFLSCKVSVIGVLLLEQLEAIVTLKYC